MKLPNLLLTVLVLTLACQQPKQQYDIVILNGTIIDGSRQERYQADVGIRGDSISYIGQLEDSQGSQVIDATDLIVSPGFIDIHTHCDFGLDESGTRANLSYLSQGVTSVVTGNCGYRNHSLERTKEIYDSLGGIGTNALPLIGFGSVRSAILDEENRPPTTEELTAMKDYLRQALQYGAWGLSTGLQYVPQKFSTPEEVIDIATVLNEFDAIYTTHMRSEEEEIMEALDEALNIVRAAGVPLNISHLKANGKENWKYMDSLFAVVTREKQAGMRITADMYPYDKSATASLYDMFLIPDELVKLTNLKDQIDGGLEVADDSDAKQAYVAALQKALINPQQREAIREVTEQGVPDGVNWVAKGGWNYFSVVNAPQSPEVINKMFTDLSEEQDRPPFDIASDLIIKEGSDLIITLSAMQEDNMLKQVQKEWVMFSSDGYAVDSTAKGVHPRSYGTAPRAIRKYVRENPVISLEEAVYKLTGFPAKTLGCEDRGLLQVGKAADVVIFDYASINDPATFLAPHQYAEGIANVLVNGQTVIENGNFNQVYAGKYLLKSSK